VNASIFANQDWTGLAIAGPITVSILGAIFGLYQARKADKSASTTKMTELAVKDLIDQYQEANKELREEVSLCHGKCTELEVRDRERGQEIRVLKEEVGTLTTKLDNADAEIIRLKLKAGEIKP